MLSESLAYTRRAPDKPAKFPPQPPPVVARGLLNQGRSCFILQSRGLLVRGEGVVVALQMAAAKRAIESTTSTSKSRGLEERVRFRILSDRPFSFAACGVLLLSAVSIFCPHRVIRFIITENCRLGRVFCLNWWGCVGLQGEATGKARLMAAGAESRLYLILIPSACLPGTGTAGFN